MWIQVTYNDGSSGSRDYCAPSDGEHIWNDQWYFIPEFPCQILLVVNLLILWYFTKEHCGRRENWNINLDSLSLQELRQPLPPADERGQDMYIVKN